MQSFTTIVPPGIPLLLSLGQLTILDPDAANASYAEYLAGTRHGWDLNAVPNLKLGER